MWLTESDAVLQERAIVIKGAVATTASSQAASSSSNTQQHSSTTQTQERGARRGPGRQATWRDTNKNVTTQACCPDGMAWYDRLN